MLTFPRFVRPAVLLAAAFIGACATATPYQPMDHGQGYAEQRIESNRYRIHFAGNSSTPKETVENYLLFRAAEFTLAQGYDYFVAERRATDVETHYFQSAGAGFGYYWHPRLMLSAGTIQTLNEFDAYADVVLFKGDKPATELRAFDAREVVENLAPLIRRPAAAAAE